MGSVNRAVFCLILGALFLFTVSCKPEIDDEADSTENKNQEADTYNAAMDLAKSWFTENSITSDGCVPCIPISAEDTGDGWLIKTTCGYRVLFKTNGVIELLSCTENYNCKEDGSADLCRTVQTDCKSSADCPVYDGLEEGSCISETGKCHYYPIIDEESCCSNTCLKPGITQSKTPSINLCEPEYLQISVPSDNTSSEVNESVVVLNYTIKRPEANNVLKYVTEEEAGKYSHKIRDHIRKEGIPSHALNPNGTISLRVKFKENTSIETAKTVIQKYGSVQKESSFDLFLQMEVTIPEQYFWLLLEEEPIEIAIEIFGEPVFHID